MASILPPQAAWLQCCRGVSGVVSHGIRYYSKYQNTFVKHNDAVVEEEVEFIFEMTSSFMKHLVKMSIKS
jgi:hypothetical protein